MACNCKTLTIENTLGDSVDAGNHPAVALRTDGDKVQINNVNILGRQNTFFVTNSGVQNRLETNRQPRTLVTNSYIEGMWISFLVAAQWCSITPNSAW